MTAFGLGLGLTHAPTLFKGGGYEAEAVAVFAAFTTPPTSARKTLINYLIRSLKLSGAWATFDRLYVMAAADSQAARINWKTPGTGNLSPVNSPLFTTDRGYTGDGSGAYLTTGFNPATAGGSYSLDGASVGIYQRTAAAGWTVGNTTARLSIADASNRYYSRLNDATDTQTGTTTVPSYGAVSRSGSAAYRVRKNGAFTTVSVASTAVTSAEMYILRSGTTYASSQVGFVHYGGAITDEQIVAIDDAVTTYMQSIGA